MFTTITSPLDQNHPVSGNREFGIFANPNGDGYTFYIMGVDRQSDWMFSLANAFNTSFDKADELWSSIQRNMANFIKNQGGVATALSPVVARPKWDDVKDYLLGNISFPVLKNRLKC